jgi:hypothetical protein
VPGRLVVRRSPDLNPATSTGQGELFDLVTADKTHRGHAIIEAVHADLKRSALAHLPSASFTANSAWLVLAVMAFNLTQAAAAITEPALAKATTPHHPAQADRRPGPDRDLRPPRDPAPTHSVAIGDRVDRTVHPRLRTTPARHHLTTQPPGASRPQDNPAPRPVDDPSAHSPSRTRSSTTASNQRIDGSRLRRSGAGGG